MIFNFFMEDNSNSEWIYKMFIAVYFVAGFILSMLFYEVPLMEKIVCVLSPLVGCLLYYIYSKSDSSEKVKRTLNLIIAFCVGVLLTIILWGGIDKIFGNYRG